MARDKLEWMSFRDIHDQSLVIGRYEGAYKQEGVDKLMRSWDELYKQAEKLAEALNAIHENASEVQPNSGWMYLSNVNYCYKKADAALADWLKFREGKS